MTLMTLRSLVVTAGLLSSATLVSAQGRGYDTATVIACSVDGRGGVCVRFTGRGVPPVERRYLPTSLDELRRTTTGDKTRLTTADAAEQAASIGTVLPDLEPPVPPPPPLPNPPGPETAFCAAIARLVSLTTLVQMGVLTADTPLVLQAQRDAADAFVDGPAFLACVPRVP